MAPSSGVDRPKLKAWREPRVVPLCRAWPDLKRTKSEPDAHQKRTWHAPKANLARTKTEPCSYRLYMLRLFRVSLDEH